MPPAGAVHALPHVAQFAGSLARLTHVLPHFDVGEGQVTPHMPPEHVWPGAHGMPQSPQFAGSRAVSAQTVPHFLVPVPHDS
jgi:hypothetical protein